MILFNWNFTLRSVFISKESYFKAEKWEMGNLSPNSISKATHAVMESPNSFRYSLYVCSLHMYKHFVKKLVQGTKEPRGTGEAGLYVDT